MFCVVYKITLLGDLPRSETSYDKAEPHVFCLKPLPKEACLLWSGGTITHLGTPQRQCGVFFSLSPRFCMDFINSVFLKFGVHVFKPPLPCSYSHTTTTSFSPESQQTHTPVSRFSRPHLLIPQSSYCVLTLKASTLIRDPGSSHPLCFSSLHSGTNFPFCIPSLSSLFLLLAL